MTDRQTRYRVTFDRIGRRHDVAPLDVDAGPLTDVYEAELLAVRIEHYARQFLGSRGVEVHLVEPAGPPTVAAGYVIVGDLRSAGTFTVEVLPEAGVG